MDSPVFQQPGGGNQPPGEAYQQPSGAYQQPGGGFQQQPGGYTPYGTGPVAAPPRKIRPGRLWYLLAVLVVLGGVAWAVFSFVSLKNEVDGFQRAPVPRGGVVTLSHSGGYVVYYEAPGANSGTLPSFNVRISPASGGAAVGKLLPYSAKVTYSLFGKNGRAVLTLQVTHPGKFLVQAPGAPAVSGGSDLAFGSSVAQGIVRIVLPTIFLVFAGIAGGITLFVVRLVKKSRRRRQGLA